MKVELWIISHMWIQERITWNANSCAFGSPWMQNAQWFWQYIYFPHAVLLQIEPEAQVNEIPTGGFLGKALICGTLSPLGLKHLGLFILKKWHETHLRSLALEGEKWQRYNYLTVLQGSNKTWLISKVEGKPSDTKDPFRLTKKNKTWATGCNWG